MPKQYRRQSFFGQYDLWQYIAVYDEKLCPECLGYARRQVFRGTHLRKIFPYLKIQDNDLINVNVHPNCRCQLLRIIDIRRYFRMLEKLEKREEK